MENRAERGKLLTFVLFIIAAVAAMGLLAGCVAANEPASSNEQDRANDGGEATKPAETETFNDETATSTTTARATIPTHITLSSNGSTLDLRYNVDEASGQLGKKIRDVTGVNAKSVTTSYTYDANGVLTGGADEINDVSREFTATEKTTQDGANVDYDQVLTYTAAPMYDGNNHTIAMVQNVTKLETDYEIDAHGHVIELSKKTTYKMSDKDYEYDEEATFNEDGLLVKYESDIEEVGGAHVGDFEAEYTYSDDKRTATELDKRDDGSNETTTFDLAYNEIGQLFRIGADGIEGTIEYYETPSTELTASIMAILPGCLLAEA